MPWTSSTTRRLLAAAGVLALLGGCVWIAAQGGLAPRTLPGSQPGDALVAVQGKLAGAVFIVLHSLPVWAAIWVGALGWGWPIQEQLAPRTAHRLLVRVTSGLGLLLALDWALGMAGLLHPWTAWLACGGGTTIIAWRLTAAQRRGVWEIDRWPNPPWTVLLGLPVLALIVIACCCPPGSLWAVEGFGYDVLSYHLQLPREWAGPSYHRIVGLKHNVYSYFPSLVEAGYMQIGAMHGGIRNAIYTTQFFHAACAMLAAANLAALAGRWVGSASAALAAVLLLLTPWVVITATLPYDEMAALALASGALLLLFDAPGHSRRGVALAGVLLGLATLAKLTVGLLLVPGVLLVHLLQLDQSTPTPRIPVRRNLALAAMLGTALLLTLAPWLLRNALWTGNPVFPNAPHVLGRAHWTPELADRWQRAHQPGAGLAEAAGQLRGRWLFSPGYGAVAGVPRSTAAAGSDITGFHRHGGVPLLILAAGAGLLAGLVTERLRRVTAGLGLLLLCQLLAWAWLTHQQARFLLPTLLPLVLLAAMATDGLERLLHGRPRWVWPVLMCALAGALTVSVFDIFFHQTRTLAAGTHRLHLPPYECIDSLTAAAANQDHGSTDAHPLNALPRGSRTLIVADARVLYVQPTFAYHTAFDDDPLGDAVRTTGGDPVRLIRVLRAPPQSFTHVWINWMELDRLMATYGYDPDVTVAALVDLSWQCGVIPRYDTPTLLELP